MVRLRFSAISESGEPDLDLLDPTLLDREREPDFERCDFAREGERDFLDLERDLRLD